MDDGTARVIDTSMWTWLPADSVESVLAHGGGWMPYTGDEDAQTVLERSTPDNVAVG